MRVILIISLLLFVIVYLIYGRFLSRKYRLDDKNNVPSQTMYDEIDYVPTHRVVLFGHHFSSIAGAGPIVGPIIAAIAFGWLPALIWILVGSIFIGGVHDFSALVASIRHRARSIADIAQEYLGSKARTLFLMFVWLALIYIIVVFADLTAATFVEDAGVAASSIIYIFIAVAFGLTIYKLRVNLFKASMIFVPLVFIFIFIGQYLPIDLQKVSYFAANPNKAWTLFLIAYCFIASLLPVWLLLQPRDYLSSYLLYASVMIGVLGIIMGDAKIHYPPFLTFNSPSLGLLFPILFITVACGAISGFHSLVASGTTSKQLSRESDSLLIGYGGMLVEGLVAIIAIATVAILSTGDNLLKQQPLIIYASGMSKFFSAVHLNPEYGFKFGLLALSAFILTTLDSATRIGRYVFQELFQFKGPKARFIATLATVAIPSILVFIDFRDGLGNIVPAWKVVWPLFGSTNQLLGALALLVLYVWLRKKGIASFFLLIPMIFMLSVTLTSLFLLILKYRANFLGIIVGLLFILALFLIYETVKTFLRVIPQRHGQTIEKDYF